MNNFKLPTIMGAAIVATALIGLSGQAVAGISSTKHNLSDTGTGDINSDNPEICVFCHTPHNAIKNNNIPLWNHTLSVTASYGVYTSPTFDGADVADVGGIVEATATVTNLCLSCHDGTVALNAMNNPSNNHLVTTMAGTGLDVGGTKIDGARSTNLGADLTNDHPVNFTYDDAADTGLVAAGTLTDVRLFSGKVQCASCHDPHASDPATQPFLRFTMDGSGLCLKCHNK
ncbi:MAG: cytochrome c3 family protein [Candidatus Polarisedimenticolaceae bacterium]|nr:cytochrome c3 family protein [Candidatus Polarisedimenticolaceae bacterium]